MGHKLGLVGLLGLGAVLTYSACSQPRYELSSQQLVETEEDPIFEDCPVYMMGRVLLEGKGNTLRSEDIPSNFYVVREEASGRPYVGVIEGIPLDPFDEGDCVELTLGRLQYFGNFAYVDRALVNAGRQIFQYEVLDDSTCLENCSRE
ncbi:MAG TPA: hypothetical protein VJA18_07180 [Candidatus Nanoarchaeia archaeon]|nr:hypothetical protein [Candidatus Nanoarchaeia archaeon]